MQPAAPGQSPGVPARAGLVSAVIIKLLGASFILNTTEDPDNVHRVVQRLQKHIDDVKQNVPGQTALIVAILAGLQAVDENIKLEETRQRQAAVVQQVPAAAPVTIVTREIERVPVPVAGGGGGDAAAGAAGGTPTAAASTHQHSQQQEESWQEQESNRIAKTLIDSIDSVIDVIEE